MSDDQGAHLLRVARLAGSCCQHGLQSLANASVEFRRDAARYAASASATTDRATLFKELDEILNQQLDPLLAKFRFTQPAFFTEYETARAIVDSAASRAAEPGVPAPLPVAA